MEKNTEKVALTTSKRQRGSFMVLALIAMIGAFALVSPSAISKTLEKCTDDKFDEDGMYDLKLSYSLGFTDTDINALQYAECVESVSPDPEDTSSVSQDNVINALSVYPELYVHIAGAKEAVSMSDRYRRLINDAREYIEVNIEPSLSAAREKALSSDLRREINELEDTIEESDEKKSALDEELLTLEEDYEKALEDFDSEQESINEAKSAIQASEKNAQTSIESGKKDLTSVLNEVYSKSVVTASDLKRAQGLSNSVSSTEKIMHNNFASQWAELSSIETQLHEDQVALTEQKEEREKEIAEEKASLSQDKIEADKKIKALEAQLETDTGRWIIEDRSSIPEYASLSEADKNLLVRFSPVGSLIFILSLVTCIIIVISIVTRNKPRIRSWQQRGLENRIIAALFVRRTGLAAALGAVIGSLAGCILSPVVYMYSYADIMGIPFSGLGGEWLPPVLGTLILSAASALTAFITYNVRLSAKTLGEAKNKPPEESLKLDQLQESFIRAYTSEKKNLISDEADDLPV
ncbi:MAG: hypothetical protein IJ641_10465 [Lachnospiraceae bacterium]|nr:hypothetical protein [Lachnospiraceae bacterium]